MIPVKDQKFAFVPKRKTGSEAHSAAYSGRKNVPSPDVRLTYYHHLLSILEMSGTVTSLNIRFHLLHRDNFTFTLFLLNYYSTS